MAFPEPQRLGTKLFDPRFSKCRYSNTGFQPGNSRSAPTLKFGFFLLATAPALLGGLAPLVTRLVSQFHNLPDLVCRNALRNLHKRVLYRQGLGRPIIWDDFGIALRSDDAGLSRTHPDAATLH
jgi:hypothetical protein